MVHSELLEIQIQYRIAKPNVANVAIYAENYMFIWCPLTAYVIMRRTARGRK